MISNVEKAIIFAVARLLTPLVRVLLRYGVPFGTFADIAKQVYVDVAMEEFAIPGRKPTVSRASVITGLSRKEVLRIRRLSSTTGDQLEDAAVKSYNRAVRVISGWVRDPQFTDAHNEPSELPFEGEDKSFSSLVRKYSGDVPPRAILDELARVGSVTESETGLIRLQARAYVPSTGDVEKIAILGTDVAELIGTIDHNIQDLGEESRLQLKVSYDNLPHEQLQQFRALSTRESRKLLELFDRELSGMDRDSNPDAKGTGRYRAGVSIYYFEEPVIDESVSDVDSEMEK